MDFEDDDPSVHRLEGSSGNQVGGLIIKKKSQVEHEFKKPDLPKKSLLGLDRLAELKRKEKEDALSLDSKKASMTPRLEESFYNRSSSSKSSSDMKRHYRDDRGNDTPSYGGGVNREAKSAIESRDRKHRRVDYTTSSKDDKRRDSRDSRDDYRKPRDDKRDDRYDSGRGSRRDRDDRRNRDRDYYNRDRPRGSRHDDDRDRDSGIATSSRGDRSTRRTEQDRSSRRGGVDSIRFKDEPLTPAFSVSNTPRNTWDDDDLVSFGSKKYSQWDYPTPNPYDKMKKSDETPLPTPAHKYNPWVKQPGSTRFMETPGFVGKKGDGEENEEEVKVDREEWEDEQKRLDREWYSMDEGYDEVHNPFAGISEDYTKKKEDQLSQRKHQRMSAQQRQIHRDNELWEKNRMLTSGVVLNVDQNEDYEEESEARVHLLVSNIVPPFLDGRIVFTKQFEPVVPVRDPNSDMALIARKGSLTVRTFREQKERKKAQKKHWELAGTKIGDILGVKKEEEKDDNVDEEGGTDYKKGQEAAGIDHFISFN